MIIDSFPSRVESSRPTASMAACVSASDVLWIVKMVPTAVPDILSQHLSIVEQAAAAQFKNDGK